MQLLALDSGPKLIKAYAWGLADCRLDINCPESRIANSTADSSRLGVLLFFDSALKAAQGRGLKALAGKRSKPSKRKP